jgi:prolyl-tRNA synthetase
VNDEFKEPMPEKLTKKSENMPRWYTDVIRMAKLADYAPVKGCMVIMPYGFSLWENLKENLDRKIKETGHKNAYFPLLIPESFLRKEAEHVEGFAPEVAWVTQGGHDQLEERLAIRPTSEAMICHMYSKWIRSWRDLPVLINQWANILRWEMVTRLFLRTTEFLWQEGHTAHATYEESEEEVLRMLFMYRDFAEEYLAMPVMVGRKSESERFAGALHTYAIEALMSDGKALQAGTSHNLGQHFAKAFDIKFLDKDEKEKYVWQTSWGVSTRLIGGIVMMHGDDAGLILPPTIAPVQVVIVPIWDDRTKDRVGTAVNELCESLTKLCRVEADLRDEYRPGWKFNEHELRGVPVRIEIGPKDLDKGQVVLVRRDTKEKMFVPRGEVEDKISKVLGDIQRDLYERAVDFRIKHTYKVKSVEEMNEMLERERGIFDSHWCEDAACEAKVKQETKTTIRCIPFDDEQSSGPCLVCKKPGVRAYFARAY